MDSDTEKMITFMICSGDEVGNFIKKRDTGTGFFL